MKKPLRPCAHPICPNLTRKKYCEQHKNSDDKVRANSHQRGYDGRWRKARVTYLSKHPVCVECAKEGRVVPATVVDHIIPHKGDKKLFWDTNNWQPLCASCHSRKTIKEDMGAW